MDMKIGYAGSFDPIHKGHLWVIREALYTFGVDKIDVILATGEGKKRRFTTDHSKDLILKSAEEFGIKDRVTVHFLPPKTFTVEYARDFDIKLMVRGIRNAADLAHEQSLERENRDIAHYVKTVFFLSPPSLENCSSSLLKSIVGYRGWEDIADKYATESVISALKEPRL